MILLFQDVAPALWVWSSHWITWRNRKKLKPARFPQLWNKTGAGKIKAETRWGWSETSWLSLHREEVNWRLQWCGGSPSTWFSDWVNVIQSYLKEELSGLCLCKVYHRHRGNPPCFPLTQHPPLTLEDVSQSLFVHVPLTGLLHLVLLAYFANIGLDGGCASEGLSKVSIGSFRYRSILTCNRICTSPTLETSTTRTPQEVAQKSSGGSDWMLTEVSPMIHQTGVVLQIN